MTDVSVHEVGTRDGLQSISTFVPTEVKKSWCRAEFHAGVREIEVCSLVPVKLIPQFADAGEVVRHALALEGLTVVALVPNLKGAEKAVELGVHKINYVISVSESHNRANVRRSTEESAADFERSVALCRSRPKEARPVVVGGLATALGCTMEGKVPEDRVRRLAVRLAEAGADEIILADTVGYGDPAMVRRLFGAVTRDLGAVPITAHFHDTRGLGLANVLAALDAGIRAFDVVFMQESMGLKTGVNLEKLLAVRRTVCAALGDQPFHGAIAKAGLPKGFTVATSA
ncbi:MAG: hydroxymethylglutaryl-CoA lyase [Betaproteobacteria bacterium]|nr:hydroxymethylglutaryl-CoA lyase [Betaproteobacteria bacterium]